MIYNFQREQMAREKHRKQRARTRLLSFLRRGRPVFCIEGTWSGYTSSQRRICHRVYMTDGEMADKIKAIRSIRFTDGTALYVSVSPVFRKEELLDENRSYDALIDEAVRTGKTDVAEMGTP